MAETVVDLVAKKIGNSYPTSKTKFLPISGGNVGGSEAFPQFVHEKSKEAVSFGFSMEQGEKLVRLYGSNVEMIFALSKELGTVNVFNLPHDLFLSLVYGIKYEMVTKPEDFFIRRTGALFFNIDTVNRWKLPVLDCMAHYFNWSDEEKSAHLMNLDRHVKDAINPADGE